MADQGKNVKKKQEPAKKPAPVAPATEKTKAKSAPASRGKKR